MQRTNLGVESRDEVMSGDWTLYCRETTHGSTLHLLGTFSSIPQFKAVSITRHCFFFMYIFYLFPSSRIPRLLESVLEVDDLKINIGSSK